MNVNNNNKKLDGKLRNHIVVVIAFPFDELR